MSPSFQTLHYDSVSHVERTKLLRKQELALEASQKEVAAHLSAFSRLQIDTENRRTDMQKVIDQMSMKLRTYEDLDLDIDKIVVRPADGDSNISENEETNKAILNVAQSFRGVPIHPERHLRQVIQLAKVQTIYFMYNV